MKKKFFSFFLAVLLEFSLLCGCSNSSESITTLSSNEFKVHFIDVDQGDSILIQVNNKNLLIDSGTASAKSKFLKYLNNEKIGKLDYIIATHPHEDHIGNMAAVINKYDIGEFYAPKVSSNTETFKRMIIALQSKNKKVNVINNKTTSIDLGENVTVDVFSPINESYGDELNNYSPIIKISYKNNSFLFTGDAESIVEKEVLLSNPNLKSNILKLGHHGSSSSTSTEFLDAVNPDIAIISCGKNNKYGHPHKETLSSLKSRKITTYETYKDGNIIFTSDGNKITKK